MNPQFTGGWNSFNAFENNGGLNTSASPLAVKDFESTDLQNVELDIWGAIKLWRNHPDYVLRNISTMFLTRNLFKINLVSEPFSAEEIAESRFKTKQKLQIPEEDMSYFFSSGKVSNYGYLTTDRINILTKKGEVIDVAIAADLPNIQVMSKIVEKHYICKAKSLTLKH